MASRDCPSCGVFLGPTAQRCLVCDTPVPAGSGGGRPERVSGRDAILERCREIYGPELRLYATGLRNLQTVAAWRVEGRLRAPHHLLVSLGLSLQGVSEAPSELSGRGFELTYRHDGELSEELIARFDRRAGEVDPELPPRGPRWCSLSGSGCDRSR